MIRLLLSLIILTLLITYVLIPVMDKIINFGKKEARRIDKAYNKKQTDEKDDEE